MSASDKPTEVQSVGWRAVLRSKRTGRVVHSSRVVNEQIDAAVILKQWATNSEVLSPEVEELFAAPYGVKASDAIQSERVKRLEEALRGLMAGCEFKTLYGVTGWHRKQMPSDAALDAAREALKEQQ